jgi:hypothetical protein
LRGVRPKMIMRHDMLMVGQFATYCRQQFHGDEVKTHTMMNKEKKMRAMCSRKHKSDSEKRGN